VIVCRMLLSSLTLHFQHDQSNWFLHPSPARHCSTFKVFWYISEVSMFRHHVGYAPYVAFRQLFP
jgi:hypothetical protein